MVAVALSKITKHNGDVPLVDNLSLRLKDGEITVLIGPSGCGKKTLLRIVAGLLAPNAGSVLIGERDVTALPAGQRGVSMVFRSHALYPHMTVAENIAFPLEIADSTPAEVRQRVREMAEPVGLLSLLDVYPDDLSGGQRLRVALARAGIRRPSLLLFDEPLAYVDAEERDSLRSEITALHRRLGATTLYVSHDLQEAMAVADRLVLLNAGRIEQKGRPADLYRAPKSKFAGEFVGDPPMNFLPAELTDVGFVCAGWRLPLEPPLELDTGFSVWLGVRPEDVVTHFRGGRGVPATVERVERSGDTRLLYLHAAGRRVVARADNGASHQVSSGARVFLEFGHVRLYDRKNGQAI